MIVSYPACFFKEDNDGYSVIFPDLNWLSTCGDTLNEALAMAVDCLAGYLYHAKIDNDTIPTPSPMADISLYTIADEIKISSDGAFVNMVSVDVDAYAKVHFEKSVKKTLTIPSWLNDRALALNVNFSQVLQDALIELVQRQKA